MAPSIYNINGAQMKAKIAAFDYDWTLVCPKEGKTFPKDVDDWTWMYPCIPEQLKRYNEEGYSVVVFTNPILMRAWSLWDASLAGCLMRLYIN